MRGGIYCLVLRSEGAAIRIGSLGERTFGAGYYIYVGSALGPGGLERVGRHLRFAREKKRTPRWHLDYLLQDPRFRPVGAVCGCTGERLECRLASEIGGVSIQGFGSSDCTCPSHLFHRHIDPLPELRSAFERLCIPHTSKSINNEQ